MLNVAIFVASGVCPVDDFDSLAAILKKFYAQNIECVTLQYVSEERTLVNSLEIFIRRHARSPSDKSYINTDGDIKSADPVVRLKEVVRVLNWSDHVVICLPNEVGGKTRELHSYRALLKKSYDSLVRRELVSALDCVDLAYALMPAMGRTFWCNVASQRNNESVVGPHQRPLPDGYFEKLLSISQIAESEQPDA